MGRSISGMGWDGHCLVIHRAGLDSHWAGHGPGRAAHGMDTTGQVGHVLVMCWAGRKLAIRWAGWPITYQALGWGHHEVSLHAMSGPWAGKSGHVLAMGWDVLAVA
jgi:hypothetical protein